MVRARWVVAGVVSMVALVALGTVGAARSDGPPPSTNANESGSVLATGPLGSDVAVLANKPDQFRQHLAPTRPTRGRAPVELAAVVLAALGAVATFSSRRHRSPVVPLVVAHPLAGIGRRAPPLLQLTAR